MDCTAVAPRLQEVQTNLGIIGGDVKSKFHFAPELEARLKAFETFALAERRSAWSRFWQFTTVGIRAGWTYHAVTSELARLGRDHARKHAWDAIKVEKRLIAGKMAIRHYLNAIVDVARFSAYERLFSLWHVLACSVCLHADHQRDRACYRRAHVLI